MHSPTSDHRMPSRLLRPQFLTAAIAAALLFSPPLYAQVAQGGKGGSDYGAGGNGGTLSHPNGGDAASGTAAGGGGGGPNTGGLFGGGAGGKGDDNSGAGNDSAGVGGDGGDGGVFGDTPTGSTTYSSDVTGGSGKAGQDHPANQSGGGGGGGAGGFGIYVGGYAGTYDVESGVNINGGLGGDGGRGGESDDTATNNLFGWSGGGGSGGTGIWIDTSGTRKKTTLAIGQNSQVTGGKGGDSYDRTPGQGGYGVVFHTGSYLSTMTNQGAIQGGNGGAMTSSNSPTSSGAYFGNDGGAGIRLDNGTLNNTKTGSIVGGDGGLDVGNSPYIAGSLLSDSTDYFSTAGAGGIGVYMQGAATLDNAGRIVGGNGGVETNDGTVTDKYRGSDVTGYGGYGGTGAAGVWMYGGEATNEKSGTITGGNGGVSHGGTINDGMGNTHVMAAGDGGDGVYVQGSGHFVNRGTITGGDGADNNSSSGNAGYGGVGLQNDGLGTIVNDKSGTIVGGKGGSSAGGDDYAGEGGDGVLLQGGEITNYGSITGGEGDVYGGFGVQVGTNEGGTITNYGTITGGNVAAAIQHSSKSTTGITVINSGTLSGGLLPGGGRNMALYFGGGKNRLELQAGSKIVGAVEAPNGNDDTLALGGDTDSSFDLGQIGDKNKFQGFEHFDKSGTSTWTTSGTPGNWSGDTTVSAGTLMLDGTLGGPVKVASGATLGGTGTASGAVTVAGGGTLTGRSGATLHIGSLVLSKTAQIDAALGQPSSTGLFDVAGKLTLDGTLNVSDAGGFGKGTYRLINYDGKLTDNGLDVGSMPTGYASSDLTVQTSVADQINLIVAASSGTSPTGTVQFWDGTGAGHAGNGKIDGGDGTWTAISTTWTDTNGKANGVMHPSPGFAIFEATPGTVTVDDSKGNVAVTDMQFASDGYTVKGDAITLNGSDSMLRVGDGTGAGAKYTATVNADITGTGHVTKTDLGTLVLDGHDRWNGTTIKDGALAIEGQLTSNVQVQTGATLSGHGTVKGNVTNTGTVAPGGSIGTLTVDGNYTNDADGVLKADIAPDGSSDLLKVTGKAMIKGGTVDVIKAAGDYSGDTRYTLVDAAKGIDGTFDTLTQNTPFLNLALGYDADHVYLNIQRNNVSFCDVAATANQCATGKGIESTGAGQPVYDAIAGLPDKATARAAFDQLSGESLASTRAALLQDSRYVREAMDQRLHRAGTVHDQAKAIPGTTGAFWAHTWDHWGGAHGDGNAASTKLDGSGLLVGIDAPLGSHLRGGVTTGVGETSVNVAARSSDAHSMNTHAGVYLGGIWGGWKVDGGVAVSWHSIDSQRTVTLAVPGRLMAHYSGRTAQAFVEGGYRFAMAHGSVEPYLNATHVAVRTDNIQEHGSVAALHSSRETTEVSYGTLGVHGLLHLSGQGAKRISAYGTLGWRHAFGSTLAVAQNYFARGERFTVAGVPWARNALIVQAGIGFAISKSTNVRVGYSGMLAKHAKDHAAKMSLQVTF